MDIQSIRRARLAQLIADKYHGSQAAFVDATNANQGEVSALLKSKSFGEKKARKIEGECGVPAGWLDTPLDGETEKPLVHLVAVPKSTDRDRAFALEVSTLVTSYAQANDEGRRSILRFVKNREAASGQSTATTTTTD
jgi:hypothetical protein